MNQSASKAPCAIDLFCGVGGLSLGLTLAGFDLIGAVDSDQKVLDSFKSNFKRTSVARQDLFTCSGAKIRRDLRIGNKRIDVLVGGPPCQGFSVGGISAKSDERNEGVLAFARIVTELRPRYFVMENVGGLLAKKHAWRRRRFNRTVSKAGYAMLPLQSLNASDFGVPQRRKRVFVVGCADGEVVPSYPLPSTGYRPTVRDAIGDLLPLDRYCSDYDADEYDGPFGSVSEFAKPLRICPEGKIVKQITGCLRTNHSPTVVERFRATKPGGQEEISRYYRLAWSGVSPTLRAGTGPDHGSHTAPRPIHPSKPRCITVREAARLHSFPDWFQFHPTKWHGFRQIGNSVPPYLAKAVFLQIYDALVQTH